MDDIAQRVQQIVAEQVGMDIAAITLDKRLDLDLGCDSLDDIEIVMALEDEFRIALPDEECGSVRTVDQAVQLVRQHLQRQQGTSTPDPTGI